jgi:hypothetical protein
MQRYKKELRVQSAQKFLVDRNFKYITQLMQCVCA